MPKLKQGWGWGTHPNKPKNTSLLVLVFKQKSEFWETYHYYKDFIQFKDFSNRIIFIFLLFLVYSTMEHVSIWKISIT